jgi:hypothetical protein
LDNYKISNFRRQMRNEQQIIRWDRQRLSWHYISTKPVSIKSKLCTIKISWHLAEVPDLLASLGQAAN